MTDKAALLKDIKLFVLDMDGTFYLGDDLIPGSLEFLEQVKKSGRRFMFFTNNSSRTGEEYIEKLAKMGCHVTRDDIMTSGDITIEYLKTNYSGKSVYLLGTETLCRSFEDAGIRLINNESADTIPDVAVAAYDRELTYEKLSRICCFVRAGAVFLSTHPDINCPTETGFVPDCGAFCAAITLSAGREPKYLGKPHKETVDMIVETTGFKPEEIAFVGDRLYTDVAVGVNNGAKGLLVLTGETKKEDVAASKTQPDAVFKDLYEIGIYLQAEAEDQNII